MGSGLIVVGVKRYDNPIHILKNVRKYHMIKHERINAALTNLESGNNCEPHVRWNFAVLPEILVII